MDQQSKSTSARELISALLRADPSELVSSNDIDDDCNDGYVHVDDCEDDINNNNNDDSGDFDDYNDDVDVADDDVVVVDDDYDEKLRSDRHWHYHHRHHPIHPTYL